MPTALQISSIVCFFCWYRSTATARCLSPSFFLLPPFLPRALAAASPACVRARIRLRSNSASAPRCKSRFCSVVETVARAGSGPVTPSSQATVLSSNQWHATRTVACAPGPPGPPTAFDAVPEERLRLESDKARTTGHGLDWRRRGLDKMTKRFRLRDLANPGHIAHLWGAIREGGMFEEHKWFWNLDEISSD
jgi:hypothetical protein